MSQFSSETAFIRSLILGVKQMTEWNFEVGFQLNANRTGLRASVI